MTNPTRCRICRTTVHPDWDHDTCPGHHITTCTACSWQDACTECEDTA